MLPDCKMFIEVLLNFLAATQELTTKFPIYRFVSTKTGKNLSCSLKYINDVAMKHIQGKDTVPHWSHFYAVMTIKQSTKIMCSLSSISGSCLSFQIIGLYWGMIATHALHFLTEIGRFWILHITHLIIDAFWTLSYWILTCKINGGMLRPNLRMKVATPAMTGVGSIAMQEEVW